MIDDDDDDEMLTDGPHLLTLGTLVLYSTVPEMKGSESVCVCLWVSNWDVVR